MKLALDDQPTTAVPAGKRVTRRAITWLIGALMFTQVAVTALASPLPKHFRPASAATATYGARAGLNYVGEMLIEPAPALARDLDMVAATGVGYLRLGFDWSHVQAGGPTSWDWTQTDRVVVAARARGLKVLALAVNSPSWASGTKASNMAPPLHASDWMNFTKAAGLRYLPLGVTAWELWNEPNIPSGWYPAVNASGYVNLVLAPGSAGLRAAASSLGKSVTVLTAGLAPAQTYGNYVSPIDFLGRVYSAGGGPAFDAAALHPYSAPYAPMGVTTGSRSAFYHAPDFYAVMANHGDSSKKVWATEIGFANGPCGFDCVTLKQQSDMVPLAFSQWRAWSFAGPMFWFQSRDSGVTPTAELRNFGLVTYTFVAKPALSTFTNLMATRPS